MTRNEGGSRFSSLMGSSTDSARSSITAKPLVPLTPTSSVGSSTTRPPSPPQAGSSSSSGSQNGQQNVSRSASQGSRRPAPTRLKTDDGTQFASRSSRDFESSQSQSQSQSSHSQPRSHPVSQATLQFYHSQSQPPSQYQSQQTPTQQQPPQQHQQVSPTGGSSGGSRMVQQSPTTPSNASIREHRMSELGGYRREMAAMLDTTGGGGGSRTSSHSQQQLQQQQQGHAAGSVSGAFNNLGQYAPYLGGNNGGGGMSMGGSFFNESTDNLSVISQLSPGIRPMTARPSQASAGSMEFPDSAYYDDERRPSIASITTTASSQGSRTSKTRGGLQKLQQFFGDRDDWPGRDSSEISLPQPSHSGSMSTGKEHRSHSYSLGSGRSHRDRNYSNATDHHPSTFGSVSTAGGRDRDASPVPSRPRTPVPAPEVVPFLYQEADDIARYGEAPVRTSLTGPDRDRYIDSSQNPPKTSSSARSGHSIVQLPGHHKHNKSNEDPRTLRPSLSREDSGASFARDHRNGSSTMMGTRSRAQSPAPSWTGATRGLKGSSISDGTASPAPSHKKGLLGRFRRHNKDKDDGSGLRSGSNHTLVHRPSRQDLSRAAESAYPASVYGSDPTEQREPREVPVRPGYVRQTTAPGFTTKLFTSKKTSSVKQPQDDMDEDIGPTDTHMGGGTVYHLDTNLNDMEGILTKPQPMTPLDNSISMRRESEKMIVPITADPEGAWAAPDSWAVRDNKKSLATQAFESEELGSRQPTEEKEKKSNYYIRVFRSDSTWTTLTLPLTATAEDVIMGVAKKTYLPPGAQDSYSLLIKKHDLFRVLGSAEQPLRIQKRLFQQIGYQEKDGIDEIGREDNSYICRWVFLKEKEADMHLFSQDINFRNQKLNHVDLSGRNLITIPVPLYRKASEIVSLNLSRNLSLDVPRDFIQACTSLRDIKYNNNEAQALPKSFATASKLTYLDVSNNRLQDLDQSDLSRLTGLLKLNLANNCLRNLPPTLGAYKSLRTLNISSNFLDVFPSFICEVETIVDLDLSFNSINNLPDNLKKLRNLEKFVITNNRLSGPISESVRDLVSLRELDIKYNQISTIDVLSDLPRLEILSADHNQISKFSGSFERLRSLKLNSNPIVKFEVKAPVPTLKILNLSNAQLASIDESIDNLMNLERLILDSNYFVSLPNQIGNLKRLDHLSMANNHLGELPPEIGCLTELRTLDVHGNNMRKLPNEIWWANKLEHLNASSNILTEFPKPASRAPQAPGESSPPPGSYPFPNGKQNGLISQTPSTDDLNGDASRRPSQASSTLLGVAVSPVPSGPDNRKSSMVSLYGKGGRKTSVVSRTTTQSSSGVITPINGSRKDSSLSYRFTHTFSGSLKNLYLADNQLDDDVFEELKHLPELRLLNLSCNDLSDMPQGTIRSWPQLVELYLSGNELTSLPAEDFLEEHCLLQTLHINGNKFINLPAEISRAKKLQVLDCSSNNLKYNVTNVPYDWNWNFNRDLRYLNLSGNKRLEIKNNYRQPQSYRDDDFADTDFSKLTNLRVLGLMEVTHTLPNIPDQTEDRRVRTSEMKAGAYLPYGMADTLGKNEHLSLFDLVVPRLGSVETDTLVALFDGKELSTGGSKIAKFLYEEFSRLFILELEKVKGKPNENPVDALRRTFLSVNKLLMNLSNNADERGLDSHPGRNYTHTVLTKEDLNSGCVATVAYLSELKLYVANVGDVQGMLIQANGSFKMLTKKHDPADPVERSRIRNAGGWVSRNGRLNDVLNVSRAFGYTELLPAVQAAPEITEHTIDDKDETVLIASKELWEHLRPELIVDVARECRSDLMQASQKLRDLAIAYGSTNKLLIMMIGVANLKQRQAQRFKGQFNSAFSMPQDDPTHAPPSGNKRRKVRAEGPLDSNLIRLNAEVPAPTGQLSIVFTDIKNSTQLWENYPEAMRLAIKLHNDVMRRQLRMIGGFEVKTEGDAFMVSFPTATSALLWCFAVQMKLLSVDWPPEVLSNSSCQPTYDRNNDLITRGLSVRMGAHWGEPLAEPDPVTRRMDYYGPMVNKASRISAVADGGQITVSSDFITEIHRCLETYKEPVDVDEDYFEDDATAKAIRAELRALSSQGFEVKDMGEKKLKGLENPELVYSVYPHALVGRTEQHLAHAESTQNPAALQPPGALAAPKPATMDPDSEIQFEPETIWGLWRVALRLEMLCSTLEEPNARGLQAPETELLERMKQRAGEVTDHFLLNFMEHQISRIETCITSLAVRHIAIGSGPITKLNDLRAPMNDVLSTLKEQMDELARYKAKYGSLDQEAGTDGAATDSNSISDDVDTLDGSDTEQE
uniref:Adenylate cyclase n=2 Tax=Sordaria macrospora TaxID=5147 RepID=B3KYI7_SORMA|nr:putative adenylate cyclase [Sordaria macrospora]